MVGRNFGGDMANILPMSRGRQAVVRDNGRGEPSRDVEEVVWRHFVIVTY